MSIFNITMVGDRELIARLNNIPGNVHKALLKKITSLAGDLRNYVIRDKLSGQVLNKVTGKLQQSIQREVIDSTESIIGRVFSAGDVKYAGIHEFGGYIPPHVIEAKNAKALSFIQGGKQVFYTRVNWPGATMPERSYLRSGLKDKQTEINEGMKEAVAQGSKI